MATGLLDNDLFIYCVEVTLLQETRKLTPTWSPRPLEDAARSRHKTWWSLVIRDDMILVASSRLQEWAVGQGACVSNYLPKMVVHLHLRILYLTFR